MSNRQSYLSTVSAMLQLSDTAQKKRELLDSFCRALDVAARRALDASAKEAEEEKKR